MPLPYVETTISPVVPPPERAMQINDAISLYRALVEDGNYPILRRERDEAFAVAIGLKHQCALNQIEAIAVVAREAVPGVNCLIEGETLTFS